ncbi:MAG: hypothetical protein ACRECH_10720, partial [Nitrososphaerales archaeon]
MKRSSVVLARCIAFVETYDLSPDGRVFFPDVVRELVARYEFQKFPKDYSEFDESKGIEFAEGRRGKDVIWRLAIFNTGILIDTRLNTTLSREIVEEALLWAKEKFGLNYEPGMIKRCAYVSQVTFYSDGALDMLNPVLKRISNRVTEAVSELQQTRIEYQTTTFGIHHDPLNRKNGVAGFIVAPRAETPLSEHKYFSEAPVPTDLHWDLLEELETTLLGSPALTADLEDENPGSPDAILRRKAEREEERRQ